MTRLNLIEPEAGRLAIETDMPIGTAQRGVPSAGMRLWDAVRVPPFLDLRPDPKTISLHAHRAIDSALRLMQAILYEALNDGMGAVELRIDPPSGDSFMRYWGPTDYARRYWRDDCHDTTVDDEANEWPKWWEMQAPPAFMFLPMMRVLLMMSRPADEKLALAHIPARAKQRRWDLHLTFPAAWTFRVSNLEAYFDPAER